MSSDSEIILTCAFQLERIEPSTPSAPGLRSTLLVHCSEERERERERKREGGSERREEMERGKREDMKMIQLLELTNNSDISNCSNGAHKIPSSADIQTPITGRHICAVHIS